jgi:translation initiation factor eIF-2B subunit beta
MLDLKVGCRLLASPHAGNDADVTLWSSGLELVITNITKRILKFLSEEYQTALSTYLTTTSSSSYPSTPYSVPQTPGWGVTGLETPGTFFPERGDPFAGRRIPSGSTGGSLGNIFDLLGHKNVAVSQHAGSSTSMQGGIGGSNNSSAPHSPHVPAAPPSPLLGHSSRSNTTTIRSPGPGAHTPNGLSPHVTTMLEEDFSKKSHSLKPVFIEAIQELMDEVEMTYRAVGEQSIDHIHSG